MSTGSTKSSTITRPTPTGTKSFPRPGWGGRRTTAPPPPPGCGARQPDGTRPVQAGRTRPRHGRIAENVMHFARVLRAAGLPIGPDRVIDAIGAPGVAGIARRGALYWTLAPV